MATDGTSDEYVQQPVNTGVVEDILIEAQRVPDGPSVKECTSTPGRATPTSSVLGQGRVACLKLRRIGGD